MTTPSHPNPGDSAAIAKWLGQLEMRLEQRRSHGLFRTRTPLVAVSPTEILWQGRCTVSFGSNDYLGLSWHPAVRSAATRAIDVGQRWGSGASGHVTGYTAVQQQLEEAIAQWLGTERCVVFGSGYAANLATLSALVGREDRVFSDQLNHASLIDGCRLSRATVSIYPHRDVEQLERLIAGWEASEGQSWIITDSVFSMEGDLAPLERLADLAERSEALMMVDEAHATGVIGPEGRGAIAEAGLERKVAVHLGTLSKSLGGVGGFVAGKRQMVEAIEQWGRAVIYSTAPPAASAAAALSALSLLRQMEPERQQLRKHALDLRERLAGDGWSVVPGSLPIVAVQVGDPMVAWNLSRALLDDGFWVPAIRPPTVPQGKAILRISLSAEHRWEQIEAFCNRLANRRSMAKKGGIS
ncbi:MAG: aminotransferase class I/II-fold pyridoxal phosphate-dependent enzyme [Pirellulaceae bacterium]